MTMKAESDGALSPRRPIPWPDPTPEMLQSREFEAVWQCIKRWDINVPDAYAGYCGATGNHVRAILDALRSPSACTTQAGVLSTLNPENPNG